MARESIKARERKRERMVAKYAAKRKKLKAAGRIVIHKCVTINHAKKARAHGADIISVDGYVLV